MSYANQRPRHAPNRGRDSQPYRRACVEVRKRAKRGERCWFWGKDPHCPAPGFDWTLPANHRWAFTTHHLDRLMDGGHVLPDPGMMVPAHRGCNARDGLRAQNQRRAGLPTIHTATTVETEQSTSRDW